MRLTEKQIRQVASELEEQFSQIYKEKRCTYSGQSMIPILKEGDRLSLIIRRPFKFVLGDLVVYQSLDKWVVHRFLRFYKTKGATFIITKADNSYCVDPLVSEQLIVGKVISITRSENVINLTRYSLRALYFFIGAVSLLEAKFIRVIKSICNADNVFTKNILSSIITLRKIIIKILACFNGMKIRKYK